MIADLDKAASDFARDGFVMVPNALAPETVARLDGAFLGHLREHPGDFAHFSDGFITAPDVLVHTEKFDAAIENPLHYPLIERLVGADFAFEELSLIQRKPTETVGELKGWHRDIVRKHERRFEIDVISVVYYLTDVGPGDHCFSIVPGTHGPRADLRPEDIRPGMEFDALGPAGTAFVFHARCIHAGKLKLGSRERRTLHLYFGSAKLARTSEWTTIPARLAVRTAPDVPALLYAKASVDRIVDGVGRRPRNLPPGTSTADQLIHVQRLANRKPEAPQ